MKRITIKAVLLISIMLTAFSMPLHADEKQTITQAFQIFESVHPIICEQGDDYSQGSGFFIEDHIFVTNYHVSGACKISQIIMGNGTLEASKVVYKSEKLDIIAYQLDEGTSLPYNTKLPKRYEDVYAVGYPKNHLSVTSGYVYTTMEKYGMKMIISKVSTDYGSSGGVLLNEYGEVVGITSRISEDKTISEAIPIFYVIEKIERGQ